METIINQDESVTLLECPCCHWRGESFLPFGLIPRQNAQCPQCKALERHRLYYLYLDKVLPQDRKLKVIHFAPEKSIEKKLKSFDNVDYLSVDINPKRAMKQEDITQISFEDNSFDVIFCSHVLEHIDDDRKAMRELRRILKPEGFAMLQVPLRMSLEKTYEDDSITDPKDREVAFGLDEHVRLYGRDYKDRLEESGFKVKVDKFSDNFNEEQTKKYFLREEDIFYCTK